jgi:hypothetical protein
MIRAETSAAIGATLFERRLQLRPTGRFSERREPAVERVSFGCSRLELCDKLSLPRRL